MKKQGMFAVLFAIALVLSASVIFAQSAAKTSGTDVANGVEGRHAGHRHHRGQMQFGFGKLNLTDAQKAQMKQVRENHKATMAGLREQMQAKRKELREATEGSSFNEAVATQKFTEMAPIEAKLMAERVAMRKEFMNLLTPEQRTQLDQMRSEWKTRRANHSKPGE